MTRTHSGGARSPPAPNRAGEPSFPPPGSATEQAGHDAPERNPSPDASRHLRPGVGLSAPTDRPGARYAGDRSPPVRSRSAESDQEVALGRPGDHGPPSPT